jgi:hypothetical protein
MNHDIHAGQFHAVRCDAVYQGSCVMLTPDGHEIVYAGPLAHAHVAKDGLTILLNCVDFERLRAAAEKYQH